MGEAARREGLPPLLMIPGGSDRSVRRQDAEELLERAYPTEVPLLRRIGPGELKGSDGAAKVVLAGDDSLSPAGDGSRDQERSGPMHDVPKTCGLKELQEPTERLDLSPFRPYRSTKGDDLIVTNSKGGARLQFKICLKSFPFEGDSLAPVAPAGKEWTGPSRFV
jgi:hypothetical protein